MKILRKYINPFSIIKSLQKLLNRFFFSYAIIFLTANFLIGCSEKKQDKKFVARVNNSYLTEDELKSALNIYSINKQELIRSWIDTELIYNQAKKSGIVNEEKFLYLIEKQKKEIAKALWIQNFFDEKEIVINSKEIEDYYNKNKESFKLLNDGFYFNEISFTNELKAIKFRNTLIESDWKKTTKLLKNDASVIEINTNFFQYKYKISSGILLRILERLQPNEVSLVINLELNKYTIVQLLQKYKADDIPSLEVIKDVVEQRVIEEKKKNLLQELINELYSQNEIEIKN